MIIRPSSGDGIKLSLRAFDERVHNNGFHSDPHPEEAAHRSRACPTSATKSVEIGNSRFRSAAVSKDGRESVPCIHPSRRAQERAPQDEVRVVSRALWRYGILSKAGETPAVPAARRLRLLREFPAGLGFLSPKLDALFVVHRALADHLGEHEISDELDLAVLQGRRRVGHALAGLSQIGLLEA